MLSITTNNSSAHSDIWFRPYNAVWKRHWLQSPVLTNIGLYDNEYVARAKILLCYCLLTNWTDVTTCQQILKGFHDLICAIPPLCRLYLERSSERS